MNARNVITGMVERLNAEAGNSAYTISGLSILLDTYRTEVLREAADHAETLRQFDRVTGARWSAQVSENVGILRVADDLRRVAMAASAEKDTPTGESTPQPMTVETYPGELAMLRGLLGVLRVVVKHGDMDEVRRLLAEHASDEQDAYTEAEPSDEHRSAAQQLARFEDARQTLQQTREQGGAL
ncbi:hypothetical protein ABT282_15780 [Streptomyces sp. NPDC000927]|uniref:hypothetical protein n=1 Tax=Streptomyces sp. NPDC000927 TaxID=3154371 RepID=UPI00331B1458